MFFRLSAFSEIVISTALVATPGADIYAFQPLALHCSGTPYPDVPVYWFFFSFSSVVVFGGCRAYWPIRGNTTVVATGFNLALITTVNVPWNTCALRGRWLPGDVVLCTARGKKNEKRKTKIMESLNTYIPCGRLLQFV